LFEIFSIKIQAPFNLTKRSTIIPAIKALELILGRVPLIYLQCIEHLNGDNFTYYVVYKGIIMCMGNWGINKKDK